MCTVSSVRVETRSVLNLGVGFKVRKQPVSSIRAKSVCSDSTLIRCLVDFRDSYVYLVKIRFAFFISIFLTNG